jgi:CrcB protein
MTRPHWRQEALELGLVAGGAIPGALLRWQLETLGHAWLGGLRGAAESDLIANLLGSLLIGVLVGLPSPRPRLLLLGAIGFCGSLTTFSSWMLELARAWARGQWPDALSVLAVSLVGGLLACTLGYSCTRLLARR